MFLTGAPETFEFVLAEKLGKTLGEIRAMPHLEYVQWQAYFEVKHNLEDLARRTEEHRAR